MSELRVDNISDAAGTGAPDFPNGLTRDGKPLGSFLGFLATEQSTGNTHNGTTVSFTMTNWLNEVDPLSAFNNTTGEFTVPTGYDGLWEISAAALLTTVQTTVAMGIESSIKVNGTEVRRVATIWDGTAVTNGAPSANITTTIDLNAGDVVTFFITRRTGGSQNYTTDTTLSWFSGTYLGA